MLTRFFWKVTTTAVSTRENTVTNSVTNTVTSVSTQTNTVTSVSTTTSSQITTATPGPIIELNAYDRTLCAVDAVDRARNAPKIQRIELLYNANDGTSSSRCVKINGNPDSVSFNVVAGLAAPSANCVLHFFSGSDRCTQDNDGDTTLSVIYGQNQCQNLGDVRSVQMICK